MSAHRDGRNIEDIKLYDASLEDLTEMAYGDSSRFLHELATDPALCRILKGLTQDQKEVIYNNAVLRCSVTKISVIKSTSDRNVRKIKEKALRHIRGQMLPIVMFRYRIQTNGKYRHLFVRGISTTFEERGFAANLGADYADYYPAYEITGKTKEDTARYAEYYNRHVMDFVEITKDYRAQEQRIRDNTARIKDGKRRRKEEEKEEEKRKKDLQKQSNDVIY